MQRKSNALAYTVSANFVLNDVTFCSQYLVYSDLGAITIEKVCMREDTKNKRKLPLPFITYSN